jgi:hypothetical protein
VWTIWTFEKCGLDNAQVRVLHFHLGLKESEPMHEHSASVLVPLTAGHIKTTSADGKAVASKRKTGEVPLWLLMQSKRR